MSDTQKSDHETLTREERFAPLDATPELGPLQQAARRGDAEQLYQLLERGHDVNEAGPDGDTAMHWAAAWGRETCIHLLIQRGADLCLTDYEDNTPLHLVSKKGFTSAHTFAAILKGNESLVNQRNKKGQTPLHAAALRGRADFIQFLISAGADPTIKDAKGNTPLALARLRGWPAAVAALEATS